MGAEREATAAEGLVVPFDVFAADTGDPAGARPERAERVPPRAPTGAEDEALVGAREVRAVDVPGCAAVEAAGSLRGSFLWDLTEANWVAKPSPMRPTARSTWPPASPRTRRRSSSVQSGKTAWSWRSSAGYWARTARAAALSSAGGRVEGPAEPAPRVPRVRRARPPRGRASAAGELEGCAEEDAAGAAGAGVSVGGAGMAEQTRAAGSGGRRAGQRRWWADGKRNERAMRTGCSRPDARRSAVDRRSLARRRPHASADCPRDTLAPSRHQPLGDHPRVAPAACRSRLGRTSAQHSARAWRDARLPPCPPGGCARVSRFRSNPISGSAVCLAKLSAPLSRVQCRALSPDRVGPR